MKSVTQRPVVRIKDGRAEGPLDEIHKLQSEIDNYVAGIEQFSAA